MPTTPSPLRSGSARARAPAAGAAGRRAVAVVSAAGVAVLYMAAVLTAPGQLLDASA
jgi:hypothetical protein